MPRPLLFAADRDMILHHVSNCTEETESFWMSYTGLLFLFVWPASVFPRKLRVLIPITLLMIYLGSMLMIVSPISSLFTMTYMLRLTQKPNRNKLVWFKDLSGKCWICLLANLWNDDVFSLSFSESISLPKVKMCTIMNQNIILQETMFNTFFLMPGQAAAFSTLLPLLILSRTRYSLSQSLLVLMPMFFRNTIWPKNKRFYC